VPTQTREVVLDPRALAEARAAFLWYLERNARAADEFQFAFERALDEVTETPLRWPEIVPGVRRRLFAKFPYSLVYVVDDARITLLAVMHHRRRPAYWQPRIRS
jgi:toxin ParE1/3/4